MILFSNVGHLPCISSQQCVSLAVCAGFVSLDALHEVFTAANVHLSSIDDPLQDLDVLLVNFKLFVYKILKTLKLTILPETLFL